MASRYSRIKDGARLNTGLNNYIEHITTAGTRPRQIGVRPPKEFQAVFIHPFGRDLPNIADRVEGKAQVTHVTTLAPLINDASTGCQVDTTVGAGTLRDIGQYKPARVTWNRASSRSASVATSAVTKLQYLKYNGVQRFSCPFGRSSATDNVYDCFLALKALLKSQVFTINRVSLQEENITFS